MPVAGGRPSAVPAASRAISLTRLALTWDGSRGESPTQAPIEHWPGESQFSGEPCVSQWLIEAIQNGQTKPPAIRIAVNTTVTRGLAPEIIRYPNIMTFDALGSFRVLRNVRGSIRTVNFERSRRAAFDRTQAQAAPVSQLNGALLMIYGQRNPLSAASKLSIWRWLRAGLDSGHGLPLPGRADDWAQLCSRQSVPSADPATRIGRNTPRETHGRGTHGMPIHGGWRRAGGQRSAW